MIEVLAVALLALWGALLVARSLGYRPRRDPFLFLNPWRFYQAPGPPLRLEVRDPGGEWRELPPEADWLDLESPALARARALPEDPVAREMVRRWVLERTGADLPFRILEPGGQA